MSLQETAGSVTGIKYVKVDRGSVAGPDPLVTVWAVVETESGRERGFVASAPQSYESNSGQMYNPVKWGSAIHRDEFKSGIQFPYTARAQASLSLLGSKR